MAIERNGHDDSRLAATPVGLATTNPTLATTWIKLVMINGQMVGL